MNRNSLIACILYALLGPCLSATAQQSPEPSKPTRSPILWDRKDPVKVPPGFYKKSENSESVDKANLGTKGSLIRKIKELEEKIRLQQIEIIELKKKCRS
ncbi:hypothetical protein BVY02_01320 [bacterium J17]|nr:hypothetical protein BVY02_01320 [bacterium J17]